MSNEPSDEAVYTIQRLLDARDAADSGSQIEEMARCLETYWPTPREAEKAVRKIERVRGYVSKHMSRVHPAPRRNLAIEVSKLLDQEESGTIHE